MEILIPIMCIGVVLALTIMLFNGLTIAAIWRTRQLRKPIKMLILNMCISDFGVGVTAIYYCLLYIVPALAALINDVPMFCLVAMYMVHVMFMGSAVSVWMVGLERCLVITYPLRYDVIMTTRRVAVFGLLSWIVILIQNTYVFWAPIESSGSCQSATWIDRRYVLWFFTGPLVVCIMVLTVFYAIIISVAAKHSKRIQEERARLSIVSLEMEPVLLSPTEANVSTSLN